MYIFFYVYQLFQKLTSLKKLKMQVHNKMQNQGQPSLLPVHHHPITRSMIQGEGIRQEIRTISQSREFHHSHSPPFHRPQRICQHENIKRVSMSPRNLQKQSQIEYLSIEGVNYGAKPQPQQIIRQPPPQIIINPPPHIIQNRPHPNRSTSQPINCSRLVHSHHQQPTAKPLSPRHKVVEMKQAYIEEQQLQVNPTIERTQSQTIFTNRQQEKIEKPPSQEEPIPEANPPPTFQQHQEEQKRTASKVKPTEESYIRVYRSMDEYLREKQENRQHTHEDESSIQVRQPTHQHIIMEKTTNKASVNNSNENYIISFNEKGDIKSNEEDEVIGSCISHNSNRIDEENRERSLGSKSGGSVRKSEGTMKNKFTVKGSELKKSSFAKKSSENQSRESAYLLRQSSGHPQPLRTSNQTYQHINTHSIIQNTSIREPTFSHHQLNKHQINYEAGQNPSSSVSIINEEQMDASVINIRLKIEEIYDRQLEIGLSKINDVYMRSLSRVNRI